ncbi:NYN domain-containing protein [Streptomyces hokutonensis]|uniref:NYN domain-containing protein n=1 Tax=Streptomyces hokutonensis TaxID=1306990 RepID=UPI00382AA450
MPRGCRRSHRATRPGPITDPSPGWYRWSVDGQQQSIQQFAWATGKNATDAASVIDATDLLHTERFDGFRIVSRDRDFTGLATRIREPGLTVYGFGKCNTLPDGLVA